MPRPVRIQQAGYVQHITCKGNDGQVLFKDKTDRQEYLRFLDYARNFYPLKVYNFCLMDNHIHLLVEPKEDGSLSRVMESVTKEYAKYFNKKYGRSGHVFQGRYKNFLVQTERYFFACSRYIDLNPVKANLVTDPKEYVWSGYGLLACGEKSVFEVDKHSLYEVLGKDDFERQVAYRTLVLSYQGEDLDLLNKSARILGDAQFKKQIKQQLKEIRSEKEEKKKEENE